VSGETRVAVAFSGGLDSAILAACAGKHAKVVACTGFVRGSPDRSKGEAGAAVLGAEFVGTELTAASIADGLAAMRLPFTPTAMDESLWCLFSAVSQSAREAGAKIMLLGQLADELFGGYAKYLQAKSRGAGAAEAMMEADFREYAVRGRLRDVDACSRWVEPRLPYGDEEVVQVAATIPIGLKIAGDDRKAVLRRAAVILGVPGEMAASAKKAAQYSSGVQKLVAGSRF
jgi:asparagine synthase (glutamine-hydrolysing)